MVSRWDPLNRFQDRRAIQESISWSNLSAHELEERKEELDRKRFGSTKVVCKSKMGKSRISSNVYSAPIKVIEHPPIRPNKRTVQVNVGIQI